MIHSIHSAVRGRRRALATWLFVAAVLHGCGGSGGCAGDATACNSTPGFGEIHWVRVSEAVRAESNTGYLTSGAAPVTITLPAHPAVGDTVWIDGAGSGWTLAQNSGQRIQTAALGARGFRAWTALTSPDPADQWAWLAVSDDGSRQLAASGRNLMLSSDRGATWSVGTSVPGSAPVAQAFALSGGGSAMLVGAANNSPLSASLDGGVTWKLLPSPIAYWQNLAISHDGIVMVGLPISGQVALSTTQGQNWKMVGPSARWVGLAASADGQVLAATTLHVGSLDDDSIYTSRDNGASWALWNSSGSGSFVALAVSGDGTTVIAASEKGSVVTSRNVGLWDSSSLPALRWAAVSASRDGERLAALATNGEGRFSADGGASWGSLPKSKGTLSLATAADGLQLFAGGRAGDAWTTQAATSDGAAGSLSGTALDSVELIYTGDGTFVVVLGTGGLTVR